MHSRTLLELVLRRGSERQVQALGSCSRVALGRFHSERRVSCRLARRASLRSDEANKNDEPLSVLSELLVGVDLAGHTRLPVIGKCVAT